MLKFIPQFSCWKMSQFQCFVIASCAKTQEIQCYFVEPGGQIHILPDDVRMPDIRMFAPCRWHALSAVQRAKVRDTFGSFLVEKYGDENLSCLSFECRSQECD